MYQLSKSMYLITQSPLHAGSGNDLGWVDSPIQREGYTGYPKIEGSSLKGAIREKSEKNTALKDAIVRLFGPDSPVAGSESKSALGFTDARILLFPIKSVKKTFVWITCRTVLNQWQKNMKQSEDYENFEILGIEGNDNIIQNEELKIGNKIILESYAFQAVKKEVKIRFKKKGGAEITTNIGDWFADNVFKHEGAYFQDKIKNDWVILADDAFRDFVQLSTEIITRNKINNDTGTADDGALFTEEYLPSDAVLYSFVLAGNEMKKRKDESVSITPAASNLAEFVNNAPDVFQIGGNATIGKGITRAVFIP